VDEDLLALGLLALPEESQRDLFVRALELVHLVLQMQIHK
jgi:hypothetical protein